MLKYLFASLVLLESLTATVQAAAPQKGPIVIIPPKAEERRIDGGTYCDGDNLIQVTWYCTNDLGTNCRKDEQSVGSCSLCDDTMSCAR